MYGDLVIFGFEGLCISGRSCRVFVIILVFLWRLGDFLWLFYGVLGGFLFGLPNFLVKICKGESS